MALTDSAFDERMQSLNTPVAKIPALDSHPLVDNTTTLLGEPFVANGVVKQLKHNVPDLTTDTDFTLEIIDQDSAVVLTKTALPDNAATTPKTYRFTQSEARLLSSGKGGTYRIRLTFGNNQTITADTVKMILFISNEI